MNGVVRPVELGLLCVRSLVNYAVLTLVLEKQSYGAEIGRRFEERYGAVLQSRWDHAYRSLRTLENHGFVERLGPRGSRRQPKTLHRITDSGAEHQRAWLRSPLRITSAEHEFTVRLLSLQPGDHETMLILLDLYESITLAASAALPPEDGSDPLGLLFRERYRLGTDTKLEWIWRLRRDLTGRAAARS